MKRPKILLTNDDGIDAPAIWELRKVLSDFADCHIVAPKEHRSGYSHAVTLKGKIRIYPVQEKGETIAHSVDGTPVDTIKIALCELFPRKEFDLIISGINAGPNAGVSVFYSGTVAAAREGLICGIPAFAVSVTDWYHQDFSYASELSKKIARGYIEHLIPKELFLNVNIPALPAHEIKGIRVTRQAPSRFLESFEKAESDGETHYRLTGSLLQTNEDQDTDQVALNENYVSITPLRMDMTHYEHMDFTKNFISARLG